MADLSVVIVNYNVEYFLEQCLHSVLRAAEGIDCEIFVVDNDSVDGSIDMVEKKFPQVKLIANKENTGFSRANNQAIRIARGRYVLLLNPDTLVEEDTFSKPIAFMDAHPEAGGLGVRMIDGKGQFLPESKRGLPTPAVAFYKIFGLSAIFPKSKTFGKYHLGYLDNDKTHQVEILSGAFMLMRKETLDRVGLLDEAFFMYGEDIDLSYRIVQAGYKNYYFPDTRIIHYKGESTKKSSVNYVFVFYRAMVIFAKKHFSKRNAKTFSFFINLAIYLRAGVAILNRFVKRIALPAIDALAIFGALHLVKMQYERYAHRTYSLEFIDIALGAYTALWILSIYINSGYEKPVNLIRIGRGILFGTISILAIYALLPESLRFSRALILLGTLSTAGVLLVIRYVLHLLKAPGFTIGNNPEMRVAIVAGDNEYARIQNLLNDTRAALKTTVHISPESNTTGAQRLNEIVEVYRLNTIIFSGQDIPSHEIIGLMAEVESRTLDFKIAPPESLYIIGSNSIEKGGELFIMDLNAVTKPINRRKKRLFDIVISASIICLSPILIWLVKSKSGYFSNCFAVLFGFKTWVAYYTPSESGSKSLPKLKKGILTPLDRIKHPKSPDQTARKLNNIYARDYSWRNDMYILVAGFKQLGRKAYSG